jgi:hypothetical protein
MSKNPCRRVAYFIRFSIDKFPADIEAVPGGFATRTCFDVTRRSKNAVLGHFYTSPMSLILFVSHSKDASNFPDENVGYSSTKYVPRSNDTALSKSVKKSLEVQIQRSCRPFRNIWPKQRCSYLFVSFGKVAVRY